MSQRVRQIHRNLIIVDQLIEPHSAWLKPAKLNDLKYLNLHSQILLDRTFVTDSIWFLAQDYLKYVHDLTTSHQINWKIPE
jgi:hypothetical protein